MNEKQYEYERSIMKDHPTYNGRPCIGRHCREHAGVK